MSDRPTNKKPAWAASPEAEAADKAKMDKAKADKVAAPAKGVKIAKEVAQADAKATSTKATAAKATGEEAAQLSPATGEVPPAAAPASAKGKKEAREVVAAIPSVTEEKDVAEPVTEKPLGRSAAGAEAAALVTLPPAEPPRLSPRERLRRRVLALTSGRIVGGLVTLGLLFLLLTSGQDWPTLLFGWVLLAIVADEFGGWFGYIGALMGLLTLFGPAPNGDPIWQVALPLVGGALLALLIVKHSGGWLVLPFAAAVFMLPIYAASEFGELLDHSLIQVANPDFIRSAIIGMLVGVGISFVRQFIGWLVRLQANFTERRLLQADRAAPQKGPAA